MFIWLTWEGSLGRVSYAIAVGWWPGVESPSGSTGLVIQDGSWLAVDLGQYLGGQLGLLTWFFYNSSVHVLGLLTVWSLAGYYQWVSISKDPDESAKLFIRSLRIHAVLGGLSYSVFKKIGRVLQDTKYKVLPWTKSQRYVIAWNM